MSHILSLTAALSALWLLLSGHVTEPLLLVLGAGSVAFVVFIAHRMDVVDHEGHPIHLSHRAVAYVPWLLWEIVKANIDVAKVILRRQMPLKLSVLTTERGPLSELATTIYANSITLTPGTVTIAVDDRTLSVHALTAEAADGVTRGDMGRRVARLES